MAFSQLMEMSMLFFSFKNDEKTETKIKDYDNDTARKEIYGMSTRDFTKTSFC